MARKFQTAKRLTGLHPLAYMGVEPSAPPLVVLNDRSPTPNDYYNFNIGTIWLVQDPIEIWMLLLLDAGVATWVQLDGGGGAAPDFPTDNGTAVVAGGELNIFGGDLINTTGVGNTVTVSLDEGLDGQVIIGATGASPAWNSITSSDGTINITAGPNTLDITAQGGSGVDSVPTDIGVATPAAGILNIFGGSVRVLTQGAGNTVTVDVNDTIADQYDTDSGSAIPVGNVLNVFGGNAIATSGSGNTITIETNEIYQADVGTAQPAANTINIVGGTGITTSASGSTITIDATGGGGGAGGVVITKFTANGTWTKHAQSQMVTLVGWSGGGGGSGGQRGDVASGFIAGGWGGTSNCFYYRIPSEFFAASESITVGSGGSGGAAAIAPAAPPSVGGNGGSTGVGVFHLISGGSGGATQFSTSSVQGGQLISNSSQTKGYPVNTSASSGVTDYQTYLPNIATYSSFPGIRVAPVGTILNALDMVAIGPVAGAGSYGGGGTSMGVINGGVGGSLLAFDRSTVVLAGGSGGAPGVNGSNGSNASVGLGAWCGGSGGGGGGYSSSLSSAAGNGGNGGIPGGGGGGGGAIGTTAVSGGNGGNGARGELWIIEELGGTGGMNSEAFLAIVDTSYTVAKVSNTLLLGADQAMVEVFDNGNNFYPGNGAGAPATFTAPATGRYQLEMVALVTTNPATLTIGQINTPSRNYGEYDCVDQVPANPRLQNRVISVVADLEIGDVVTYQFNSGSGIEWQVGGTVTDVYSTRERTYVSGFRVA